MLRILVVDDDPDAVSVAAGLFEDAGHDVAPFTGGADAVHALSREPFDVVLTDLEMPDVGGREVVRAARDLRPDACVIVVSGRAGEEAHHLIEAGACLVVDKPLDVDAVTKAITECRAGERDCSRGACVMRSRPLVDRLVGLRRR